MTQQAGEFKVIFAFLNIASQDNLGAETGRMNIKTLAAGLRDLYGSTFIITNGEQGCVVAPGGATGEAKALPAYPPIEVMDTTGAGDVFRAGMIYGHLHGWEVIESAQFASAAAALNCGTLGGWTGVPSAKKIRKFQHKALQ